MNALNLRMLEGWCEDALFFLPTSDLPASIVEMRRETIRSNSGKRALYEIAADLAEGIGDLPANERAQAQAFLLEKHGIGYDFFNDAKMKSVRKVLMRGLIQNDGEYREMLDVAGDTTLGRALRESITQALAAYEKKHST